MKRMGFRAFLSSSFILLAGVAFCQTSDQYLAAGNQLYAAKNYEMAAKYYQAAAQLNPNSAAAYQGLGSSYYQQGQTSQAVDAFDKALALNPSNTALSNFVQSLKARLGVAPAAPASPESPNPASSTPGYTTQASSSQSQKIELDIDAGLALSNITGFGGGAAGFVPIMKSLSLGAMASYYTFSLNGGSISFIEFMGAAKYRFPLNGFTPYALAGVGISDAMALSISSINPMAAIGGGAEFAISKDMNLFGQVVYSIVVSTGTSTYMPITAGLNFKI